MKVAVIGNKDWQNKRKVQETLRQLKTQFDEVQVIGAGGSEGLSSDTSRKKKRCRRH